jgi:hypothetical protein
VEQLIPTSAALQQAALEPVALEVISDSELEERRAPGTAARLLVRVQGNDETLAAAGAEVMRAAGRSADQLTDDEARAIWTGLGDVSARAEVSTRLAALPSMAMDVWSAAARIGTCMPHCQVALHVGAGIVRVDGAAPTDQDRFERAVLEARAAMARLRGTIQIWAAPSALFESLAPPPARDEKARLTRELKTVFDPAGIMAPNRLGI